MFSYLSGFDLSFSPNKSGQSSHVDEILGPGQDLEGPFSAWPGYLPKPERAASHFLRMAPDSSEKTVQLLKAYKQDSSLVQADTKYLTTSTLWGWANPNHHSRKHPKLIHAN